MAKEILENFNLKELELIKGNGETPVVFDETKGDYVKMTVLDERGTIVGVYTSKDGQCKIYRDNTGRVYVKPSETLDMNNVSEGKYKLQFDFLRDVFSDIYIEPENLLRHSEDFTHGTWNIWCKKEETQSDDPETEENEQLFETYDDNIVRTTVQTETPTGEMGNVTNVKYYSHNEGTETLSAHIYQDLNDVQPGNNYIFSAYLRLIDGNVVDNYNRMEIRKHTFPWTKPTSTSKVYLNENLTQYNEWVKVQGQTTIPFSWKFEGLGADYEPTPDENVLVQGEDFTDAQQADLDMLWTPGDIVWTGNSYVRCLNEPDPYTLTFLSYGNNEIQYWGAQVQQGGVDEGYIKTESDYIPVQTYDDVELTKQPQFYLKEISPSRKEIRLIVRNEIDDISFDDSTFRERFIRALGSLNENNSEQDFYNFDFVVNSPDYIDNYPVINYVFDDLTDENKSSLILRLNKPLNTRLATLEKINLHKEIITTQTEQVFYIADEKLKDRGKGLSIDESFTLDEYPSAEDTFQNQNNLIDSGGLSRTTIDNLNTKLSEVDSNLNIDYDEYSNHTFFGSAVQKLKNFDYKYNQINTYYGVISESLQYDTGSYEFGPELLVGGQIDPFTFASVEAPSVSMITGSGVGGHDVGGWDLWSRSPDLAGDHPRVSPGMTGSLASGSDAYSGSFSLKLTDVGVPFTNTAEGSSSAETPTAGDNQINIVGHVVSHHSASGENNPTSGINVEAGKRYYLEYAAKASVDRQINVNVQQETTLWHAATPSTENIGQIDLAPSWSFFTGSFTAASGSSNIMVNFLLGAAQGDVFLDSVSLREIKADKAPQSTIELRKNAFNEIKKIKDNFTPYERWLWSDAQGNSTASMPSLGRNYAYSIPVNENNDRPSHAPTTIFKNFDGFDSVYLIQGTSSFNTATDSDDGKIKIISDKYRFDSPTFNNYGKTSNVLGDSRDSGSIWVSMLIKNFNEAEQFYFIENPANSAASEGSSSTPIPLNSVGGQTHEPQITTIGASLGAVNNFNMYSWTRLVYELSASYWRPTAAAGSDANLIGDGNDSSLWEIITGSLQHTITSSDFNREIIDSSGEYPTYPSQVDSYTPFKGAIAPMGSVAEIFFYTGSGGTQFNYTASYITDVKITKNDPRETLPFSNVYHTGSTKYTNWYSGSLNTATTYDENNIHSMFNNLPSWIRQQPNTEKEDIEKFIEMWGEHFDLIRNYIDNYLSFYNRGYGETEAVPNNLLPILANSLGWELINPHTSSLSDYFNTVDGGNDNINEITNQTWRKALNNLIYLYKSKGTLNGIRGLMNIYGYPADFLTPSEFGGSTEASNPEIFTNDIIPLHGLSNVSGNVSYEASKEKINYFIFGSGSRAVHLDWQANSASADGIEFTFRVPSGSWGDGDSLMPSHSILALSSSNLSTGTDRHHQWDIALDPPEGKIHFRLHNQSFNNQKSANNSLANNHHSISIQLPTGSDFDYKNKWVNVYLTQQTPWYRTTWDNQGIKEQSTGDSLQSHSADFRMYVGIQGTEEKSDYIQFFTSGALGKGEAIPQNFDATSNVMANYYSTGSNLSETGVVSNVSGNLVVGEDFSGSISEIRFWSGSLSASKFKQHILNKRSTVANDLNMSTDNLIAHYRFGDVSSNKNTATMSLTDANPYGPKYKNNDGTFEGRSYTKTAAQLVGAGFATSSNIMFGVQYVDNYKLSLRTAGSQKNDNKIITEDAGQVALQGSLSPHKSQIIQLHSELDNKRNSRVNEVEIVRTPSDTLDKYITDKISDYDLTDSFAGPENLYSRSYDGLSDLRKTLYKGVRVEINKYIRAQTQILTSQLISSTKAMLPARAQLNKVGVLIKSPLIHRSKHHYNPVAVDEDAGVSGSIEVIGFTTKSIYSNVQGQGVFRNTGVADYHTGSLSMTGSRNHPEVLSESILEPIHSASIYDLSGSLSQSSFDMPYSGSGLNITMSLSESLFTPSYTGSNVEITMSLSESIFDPTLTGSDIILSMSLSESIFNPTLTGSDIIVSNSISESSYNPSYDTEIQPTSSLESQYNTTHNVEITASRIDFTKSKYTIPYSGSIKGTDVDNYFREKLAKRPKPLSDLVGDSINNTWVTSNEHWIGKNTSSFEKEYDKTKFVIKRAYPGWGIKTDSTQKIGLSLAVVDNGFCPMDDTGQGSGDSNPVMPDGDSSLNAGLTYNSPVAGIRDALRQDSEQVKVGFQGSDYNIFWFVTGSLLGIPRGHSKPGVLDGSGQGSPTASIPDNTGTPSYPGRAFWTGKAMAWAINQQYPLNDNSGSFQTFKTDRPTIGELHSSSKGPNNTYISNNSQLARFPRSGDYLSESSVKDRSYLTAYATRSTELVTASIDFTYANGTTDFGSNGYTGIVHISGAYIENDNGVGWFGVPPVYGGSGKANSVTQLPGNFTSSYISVKFVPTDETVWRSSLSASNATQGETGSIYYYVTGALAGGKFAAQCGATFNESDYLNPTQASITASLAFAMYQNKWVRNLWSASCETIDTGHADGFRVNLTSRHKSYLAKIPISVSSKVPNQTPAFTPTASQPGGGGNQIIDIFGNWAYYDDTIAIVTRSSTLGALNSFNIGSDYSASSGTGVNDHSLIFYSDKGAQPIYVKSSSSPEFGTTKGELNKLFGYAPNNTGFYQDTSKLEESIECPVNTLIIGDIEEITSSRRHIDKGPQDATPKSGSMGWMYTTEEIAFSKYDEVVNKNSKLLFGGSNTEDGVYGDSLHTTRSFTQHFNNHRYIDYIFRHDLGSNQISYSIKKVFLGRTAMLDTSSIKDLEVGEGNHRETSKSPPDAVGRTTNHANFAYPKNHYRVVGTSKSAKWMDRLCYTGIKNGEDVSFVDFDPKGKSTVSTSIDANGMVEYTNTGVYASGQLETNSKRLRSKKWVDHSTASFYTVATTGQNRLQVERGVTELRDAPEGSISAPGQNWFPNTGSDGNPGSTDFTDEVPGQDA